MCSVSEWILEGRPRAQRRTSGRGSSASVRLCEAAEPLDLKLELDEVGRRRREPIHFLALVEGELIGYAGMTRDARPRRAAWCTRAGGAGASARSLLDRCCARSHEGLDARPSCSVCEELGPDRARLDAPARSRRRSVGAADDTSRGRGRDRHPVASRRAARRSSFAGPPRPTAGLGLRLLMERFDETAEEIEERLATLSRTGKASSRSTEMSWSGRCG